MGVTRPQSHAIVPHFHTKGLKREPAGYEQRDSTEIPIKFFIETIQATTTGKKLTISGAKRNTVLYWNGIKRDEPVFLVGLALRLQNSDHKVSAGKGH